MVVEKVSYNVNWQQFKRGYSIFIPCLNPVAAKKEIMLTLRRLRIEVISKVVIEEGIQGLRLWRA
jgi:hypothetical protein